MRSKTPKRASGKQNHEDKTLGKKAQLGEERKKVQTSPTKNANLKGGAAEGTAAVCKGNRS